MRRTPRDALLVAAQLPWLCRSSHAAARLLPHADSRCTSLLLHTRQLSSTSPSPAPHFPSFPRHPTSPSRSTPPLPPLPNPPTSSLAATFSRHGPPASCLSLSTVPLPSPLLPTPTSVLLRFLSSPINPSDINAVEGSYAVLPPLPAVGGSEGVAEVAAVGAGVQRLRCGDWVLMGRGAVGTWREWGVVEEEDVDAAPAGLTEQQAAMLAVNPCTAYRLLHDFVSLQPGDVVVQNGATSAVGQAVIQLARILQLRSVNVMRPRGSVEETEETRRVLAELGSTVTLLDDATLSSSLSSLSLPAPALALNCVGGQSSTAISSSLRAGGVMVTYGGMSRRPVQLSTGRLIFRDIACRGFWLTRWNDREGRRGREETREAVAQHVRQGQLRLPPVDVVPLQQLSSALQRYDRPHRGNSVVLKMG